LINVATAALLWLSFVFLSPVDDAPARPSITLDADHLRAHVDALASDEFEGRDAGTDGGRLAAGYMENQFKALDLKPGVSNKSFRQAFRHRGDKLTNVIARIDGSDADLKDECIVIGAHFDHLGRNGDQIYNGADDNASGCAAILEIARHFASPALGNHGHPGTQGPPRRSLLFIAFDGEEDDLAGSRWFVKHPTVPLKRIAAMINLDMISRGETGEVRACGPRWSPGLDTILQELAPGCDLKVHADREREWRHASDHGPFGDEQIPFLYLGVLDHVDYHRPTDTADKVDIEKLRRIATLAGRVVERLANADDRPTFDPKPPPASGR